MNKALEGVKVADFSWVVAGPHTSKYLADYGAKVIRVETEKRPCSLRLSNPFAGGIRGINRSGYFALLSANKYSVAIDLSKPKGIALAKKLILWSDVVVENFRPGIMKRFGLDYQSISPEKSKLVWLSLTAQGQTGPHATSRAYGIQLATFCGFTHFTGWPDRMPVIPFSAYTDYTSPRFAVAALVAALDYKNRTGKGQYLDLSQDEAALQLLSAPVFEHTAYGKVSGRVGNKSACAAPHNVYRCQGEDRWCAVAVFSAEHWHSFCQAIGEPAWTQEPRFTSLKSRKENEEELDMLVEAWTVNYSAEHVMNQLQAVGIPAGVVKKAKDIIEDEQLTARNYLWKFDHAEMGETYTIGQSSILSETSAEPYAPPPGLGEHTEYVCKEILNIADDEFIDLLNEDVLS